MRSGASSVSSPLEPNNADTSLFIIVRESRVRHELERYKGYSYGESTCNIPLSTQYVIRKAVLSMNRDGAFETPSHTASTVNLSLSNQDDRIT